MNIGEAIEAMKRGDKVQRPGWNGKNMHLWLWSGAPQEVDMEPCIVMYTAQGKHQPGWLANQQDLLADDWMVLDE